MVLPFPYWCGVASWSANWRLAWGVCGHYNHTCLWALYVGFVNPCALSRTTTKYETENQAVKKDSINSDAIRLLRALLAPRSHYDNEDYGADEAIQGG